MSKHRLRKTRFVQATCGIVQSKYRCLINRRQTTGAAHQPDSTRTAAPAIVRGTVIAMRTIYSRDRHRRPCGRPGAPRAARRISVFIIYVSTCIAPDRRQLCCARTAESPSSPSPELSFPLHPRAYEGAVPSDRRTLTAARQSRPSSSARRRFRRPGDRPRSLQGWWPPRRSSGG